jgi:hypothetical protein
MEITITGSTIIYAGILVFFIAIFDYFWIGRKLIENKEAITPKEMIVFYFGRTTSEFLVFFMGVLLGMILK